MSDALHHIKSKLSRGLPHSWRDVEWLVYEVERMRSKNQELNRRCQAADAGKEAQVFGATVP